MDNSESMSVLNPTYDLLKNFTSFILIHLFLLDNVVKKLTIFHVLHNQE